MSKNYENTNNELLTMIAANTGGTQPKDGLHLAKIHLENGVTNITGVPFKPRMIEIELFDNATGKSTYIARGKAAVLPNGTITQSGWGNFRSDASNHSGNISSEAHIIATCYWNGSSSSSNCRSAITSITQEMDETWTITFSSTNMSAENVKNWWMVCFE